VAGTRTDITTGTIKGDNASQPFSLDSCHELKSIHCTVSDGDSASSMEDFLSRGMVGARRVVPERTQGTNNNGKEKTRHYQSRYI
jgi:hypothetical protein